MDKKTLRPSSIGSFINCQWQWYNVFILGKNTIPGARAHLGTGIHKAAEVLWLDAMEHGKKDLNVSKATDAAFEEYKEICKQQPPEFGDDNPSTIEKLVIEGAKSFINDIAPSVEIPEAVEKRYTVEIDNKIFDKISGSLDYVGKNSIHDIKTTKKKPVMSNYTFQQGTYALLREANGEQVDEIKIQAVVLKDPTKKTEASAHGLVMDLIEDSTNPFLSLEPIKNQSRYIINNILAKSNVYAQDIVSPDVIFTGNPKSFLCSNKFCSLYNECPWVNGDI